MKLCSWRSVVANSVAMLASISPAFSQGGSHPPEQWSGSVQCQLAVQQQGYVRQEVQTWTLTGGPPTVAGGTGVWMYPATWTYQGQGQLQRQDGTRMTIAQWNINVVPGEAPFSFAVRDGVLTVKRASGQQRRYQGFTGQRQIAVNGMAQPPIPMTSASLWEWPLTWIEAAPGPNVSGTMNVQTENINAEIQQPGPPPFATCRYQFTKAGGNLTPVSGSCPPAGSIAQTFETMKANLARDFDALLQQTQDPARRAALNAQKQRLLRELDALKQQNVSANSAACQGPAGTNTANSGGGTGTGTATGQNPPNQAPPAAGQPGNNQQNQTTAGGQGQSGGNSTDPQRSAVPQLVSITPSSVDQGSTNVQVALTAHGTNWQMGATKVDFGPGITPVAGPFVTSAGEAYVVLAVAADAATGTRPVRVTTGNDAVSMPSAFTVNAKASPGQAPGSTSPVNALGGGGPKYIADGGKTPTFTTSAGPQPTASSTPTADVAPVLVTTTQPPTGSQASAGGSQVSPGSGTAIAAGKSNFPKGGKTLTAVSTPTPSQPTNQPPASGKYLVTMTGLWCSHTTQDDPLDFDGHGDEIYAAAFVRKYDRNTSTNTLSYARQTWIYGDSNKSDRIQAGSQTQLGGIRAYDSIPNNITADRRFPPQDSNGQFPYKLWGGTLTDGVDVLLISPSIWESDGKPAYFYQWNQKQNAINDSIYMDTKVLDQVSAKRFGPLTLGATSSVAGTAQRTTSDVITGGALAVLGIPPLNFFIGGADRPIGLVGSGPDQNALPNTAIVLSREIVELALASPYSTYVPAAPGVNISISKPGIMVIAFTDTSTNIGGNSVAGDARANYVMTVQVERCEGSLLQYCQD